MVDTKKEQEREELHRAIWAIADDLRGAADRDHSEFEVDSSVSDACFGRYYRYGIGRNYGGRQG